MAKTLKRQMQTISIHAPRGGSDQNWPCSVKRWTYFNPRSPWGSDSGKSPSFPPPSNFNPRSPWGSDCLRPLTGWSRTYFNPRSPWGERQLADGVLYAQKKFQSTLPVGGATETLRPVIHQIGISIHAPRGGSDCVDYRKFVASLMISIHAPRGGSDPRSHGQG